MLSFKLLPFFKVIVISIFSKLTLILFTDFFLLKSFSIERAQKSHTSPLTEILSISFSNFSCDLVFLKLITVKKKKDYCYKIFHFYLPKISL